MSDRPDFDQRSCPLPILDHDTIQLAHGAGGRLSSELIEKLILPRFSNLALDKLEDQAVLAAPTGRLAFSTDTFVVDPIVFPGGDIGDLAINGTVNDVAMCGAKPLYLSVGFVLEEGLPIADFHRILCSMQAAAATAGVQIVTGDTKVVNRGCCDKIFINTAGIGVLDDARRLSSASLQAGDQVLISGTVADHGMAIMTVREGLSFNSRIDSDSVALNGLVEALFEAVPGVRTLRDPTRGGAATTLNEFAAASGMGIKLDESAIPIRADVSAACEILGIDPMYVANEGKMIAVVPAGQGAAALNAMRRHPLGENAALIGEVVADHPGTVTVRTPLGVERILDMPIGEQLPRIC